MLFGRKKIKEVKFPEVKTGCNCSHCSWSFDDQCTNEHSENFGLTVGDQTICSKWEL